MPHTAALRLASTPFATASATSSTSPSATAPAPLSRRSDLTLAEQLAAQVGEHIRQRLLAPGTRLPSVREAARRHGVSPHTVVAAYDQLLAQGLVEARRQRGFFVRETRREAPGTRDARPPDGSDSRDGSQRDAPPTVPVDANTLIRGMLGRNSQRPGPGLGTLPPDWLDADMLNAALRRVLTEERERGSEALSLCYGEPAGDLRLRTALAQRLGDVGVRAAPEQIVTAQGATQALDLVSRSLLTAGDAVLVDDPGWSVEYARLVQLGMRLLPVPRGIDGPDLVVMDTLARAHRPRLYVTVSVLHNPTGHLLSLSSAHRLLELAQAHDLQIVEDDTYAYLAPNHAPRLAALDGLRRTFYVSGFAKILAPGWRVGYVAAPPDRLEALVDTKMLASLTTSALLEQALAFCLEQGLLRRHAERVNQRLDAARGRSVARAEAAGCKLMAPPQGLFGWIDTGVDTARLATLLLDEGWLLAPGHLFHPNRRASTCMRINFASSQDARFWQAFERARDSLLR